MHAGPLVVLVESDQHQLVAAESPKRLRRAVAAENRVTLRPGEAPQSYDFGEEGLIVVVERREPLLCEVVGHEDLAGQEESGGPPLELVGDRGDHVDVRLEAERGQQARRIPR